MKINKLQSGFAALCMGMALAFSACTDSVDRDPSPVPTDGVQAYIYGETPTSYSFLPDDEQSLEITIGRQTQEAATVHLESEGEGFNVPATVEFAAGEQKKNITITFNMAIGETRNFTLRVAEADAYTYSRSEIICSVARNYKYSPIGKGVISSTFFEGKGQCNFEKAEGGNWYKAIEPYAEGYDLILQVQEDGKTVIVPKQTVASSYGQYGALSATGQGTLENGVITINMTFSVPQGTFEGAFEEVFTLPAPKE